MTAGILRRVLATVVVAALTHSADGESPQVSLAIEAAPNQPLSDGLRVTATIALNGGGPYIVLPPLLDVPPWASDPYPSTAFSVEVSDLLGKALPRVPVDRNTIYVQTAPPSPCEFLVLRAGQFVGKVLRLSDPPFSYILGGGKVRVRVRTRSTARAWLAQEMRARRLAVEGLCFRLSEIYDRPLTSNEIEVSLE